LRSSGGSRHHLVKEPEPLIRRREIEAYLFRVADIAEDVGAGRRTWRTTMAKKTPEWFEERMKAIEEFRESVRRSSKRYYAAQAARQQGEQPPDG
jgi:hypothetical protein